MGLNYEKIFDKVSAFKPIFERGNNFEIIFKNKNTATIINDAYNANPASMIAALNNVIEIKKSNEIINIVLIIGDMLELGQNTKILHEKLIPLIKLIKPRYLITVGRFSKVISTKLKDFFPCQSFANTDDLKEKFFSIIKHQDLILIKGSNGTGLFKFTNYLHNTFLNRS